MSRLPLIDKEEQITKAVKVFRAVHHPLRKEILKLLEEKKQARVTEIYVDLGLEQSVASAHLKILRKQRLWKQREKVRRFYIGRTTILLQSLKK